MTTSLAHPILNSNPFPGLQELRADMSEFLNSLDDFVRQGKKDLDVNREAFINTLRSDKEKRSKLQAQIDVFERKREEMQKLLNREKEEIHALEMEISEMSLTEKNLSDRAAELKVRFEQSKQFFDKKSEVYQQREDRRKVKYANAVPKVRFFEDTLGLFIEGLGGEGLIRFRFNYIDKRNPTRDFYFVTDTRTGKIIETNPKLDIPHDLDLEISNIKDIRQKFVELVVA